MFWIVLKLINCIIKLIKATRLIILQLYYKYKINVIASKFYKNRNKRLLPFTLIKPRLLNPTLRLAFPLTINFKENPSAAINENFICSIIKIERNEWK